VSAAAFAELLADLPTDRKARLDVVADRDLEARRLIEVADAAAAAGIREVRLITLRGGAR
jgi:biopolymer transport protein ExbD